MNYKKIVLEHYGGCFEHENNNTRSTYDVVYSSINTADGYEIFKRSSKETSEFLENDLYLYAENCLDDITEEIKDGKHICITEEIAEECGLDEEGNVWQSIYETYIEE